MKVFSSSATCLCVSVEFQLQKLFQSDGVDPPVRHLYHMPFLWLSHMACGIFIPQPGIESRPAVGVQSCNLWPTWEFSQIPLLSCKCPKVTFVYLF